MVAISLIDRIEHIIHNVVDVRQKGVKRTEVSPEHLVEIKRRVNEIDIT